MRQPSKHIFGNIILTLSAAAIFAGSVYILFFMPYMAAFPLMIKYYIVGGTLVVPSIILSALGIIKKIIEKARIRKSNKLADLMKNGHILTEEEQKYREKFARKSKDAFKEYKRRLSDLLNRCAKAKKEKLVYSAVTLSEDHNYFDWKYNTRSVNKILDKLSDDIKNETANLNSNYCSNIMGLAVFSGKSADKFKLANGNFANENMEAINKEIEYQNYQYSLFKFYTEKEADDLLDLIENYKKKFYYFPDYKEEEKINAENGKTSENNEKLTINLAHNTVIDSQVFKTNKSKSEDKSKDDLSE